MPRRARPRRIAKPRGNIARRRRLPCLAGGPCGAKRRIVRRRPRQGTSAVRRVPSRAKRPGEGVLRACIAIDRQGFSAILCAPILWFSRDLASSSGLFCSRRPCSRHDPGSRRICPYVRRASRIHEKPYILWTGDGAIAHGRKPTVPYLASSARRKPCAKTRMSEDDRPSGRPAGRPRPLVSTSPGHIAEGLRITW
jgi:hypothetical protein